MKSKLLYIIFSNILKRLQVVLHLIRQIKLPFSVGDARDIEVKEEESFTFDDTESKES